MPLIRRGLDTARRYKELGEHGRQFALYLTYVALDRGDTFSAEELRIAFRALPVEALAEAASAVTRGMEGAGENREHYWRNRVLPFLSDIWPRTNQPVQEVADDFFRLCVASRDQFPEVLETVRYWLVPVRHPDFLVHLLVASSLCSKFPSHCLQWLGRLIEGQLWTPRDLRRCLNSIIEADPSFVKDATFVRLDAECRRAE